MKKVKINLNVESESYVNNDTISAIKGLMKNVKKSSVELQHEARDNIASKYLK